MGSLWTLGAYHPLEPGCAAFHEGRILGRALNMLNSQIAAQGKAFEETGGFSERLHTRRLEAREGGRAAEPAPACPQCAQPMRRRRSAKGDFWGCTAYPACRGTKPV